MYNYFMLVGYVVSDVELREVKDGKKVVNLLLSVRRDFKNASGEFSYDVIRISLWEFMAEIAADTIKKGSKLGIKGRIYPRNETHEKGFQMMVNDLIAERLIFFDDISKEEVIIDSNQKEIE